MRWSPLRAGRLRGPMLSATRAARRSGSSAGGRRAMRSGRCSTATCRRTPASRSWARATGTTFRCGAWPSGGAGRPGRPRRAGGARRARGRLPGDLRRRVEVVREDVTAGIADDAGDDRRARRSAGVPGGAADADRQGRLRRRHRRPALQPAALPGAARHGAAARAHRRRAGAHRPAARGVGRTPAACERRARRSRRARPRSARLVGRARAARVARRDPRRRRDRRRRGARARGARTRPERVRPARDRARGGHRAGRDGVLALAVPARASTTWRARR